MSARKKWRFLVLAAVLAALVSALQAWAEVGDVRFSVESFTISRPAGLAHSTPASVDVVMHIEDLTTIPAVGWSAIFSISPGPSAIGSVVFDPPSTSAGIPNLEPSYAAPFRDFDRDYDGKSFGALRNGSLQLAVFSTYVEPIFAPPPPLDSDGNLTLPSGSGLVRLPLLVSPNAAGNFLISVDSDPLFTGALFATSSDGLDFHSAGPHQGGALTVSPGPAIPGDYNLDGRVSDLDYDAWRASFGQSGASSADGNGNGVVDAADYVIWRDSVPSIPGDYNLDGRVSDLDYDAWRASFGKNGASSADGNGNGVVDAADYVIWRDSLPGDGVVRDLPRVSIAEVPEPTSSLLIAGGLALIVGLKRLSARRSLKPTRRVSKLDA